MSFFPTATRRRAAWYLLLLPLLLLEYGLSERPDWELLAWVAPLLWLLFFQHTPALVAYGVGVLGLTLVASTQHEVNVLTGVTFHVTNVLFAATYLLPFLLSRALAGRVPAAGRWLLPPLAAVGVEYGLALGPNGTWGSVGYSQGNLYLLQLTALTGIYGITFLVYATASLLATSLLQWRTGGRGGRAVLGALVLVAGCLGLGWRRVQQQEPARASVRVLGLTFQDAHSWPWFRQVVWNQQLTLGRDSALIRPRARAAAKPAYVRSWISSRSNSASEANRLNTNCPCGEAVLMASVSETNPTSRNSNSATMSSRCFRERSRRSSL